MQREREEGVELLFHSTIFLQKKKKRADRGNGHGERHDADAISFLKGQTSIRLFLIILILSFFLSAWTVIAISFSFSVASSINSDSCFVYSDSCFVFSLKLFFMRRLLLPFLSPRRRPHQAKSMDDINGILKVRVIQGIKLSIRDIYSSDPYVKLRIGDHQVKTRVIHNNLNPRWDELLTLATRDPPEPLMIDVFDKDMFTPDDKMGEAQIDLNPLINTVKETEISDCQEGVPICNVPATRANRFVRDSVIKVKSGQIVQRVSIQLQNVESGEIKLELMWQPYP